VTTAMYVNHSHVHRLEYSLLSVLTTFICTFRPHRSTTYEDAACCYWPSSVVCHLGWVHGWAQGTMY